MSWGKGGECRRERRRRGEGENKGESVCRCMKEGNLVHSSVVRMVVMIMVIRGRLVAFVAA